MVENLGTEYLTRGEFRAMSVSERFEWKAVTGNVEQDFEKLLRRGCIDGHVEGAAGWRREIRRRARRAGVRIRTADVEGYVLAWTLHYDEHCRAWPYQPTEGPA